jgi:hypothetical protein
MPIYYLIFSFLLPIFAISATVGFAKRLCLSVDCTGQTGRSVGIIFSVWILICLFNISFLNWPGLYLVYGYILTGNIFLIHSLFKKTFSPPSLAQYSLVFLLFIWFGTTCWLYFQFPDLNCDDDLTVYLRHISMFLESGNLDDIFSYRRMSSYAGQTFLASLFLGGLPVYIATVFELGIINPLIVFLLFEECKKTLSMNKSFLLSLSFLLVPQFRLNVAAQSTAIYFSLLALIYLREFSVVPKRTFLWFFFLSLLALLSLRNNFIVLFGGLAAVAGFIQYRRSLLSYFRLDWLLFLLILCLFGYSTFRSSNTVLFPLFEGNFNTQYGLFSNDYSARFFRQYFIESLAWSDILAVLICLLYLVAKPKRHYLLISAGLLNVFFILATTYALRALLIPWHIGRYTESFSIAFIFLTLIQFLNDSKTFFRQKLAALAVCLILFSNSPIYFINLSTQNFSDTKLNTTFIDKYLERKEFYKNLLSQFPEGSSLISMVNDPYLFDYTKHRIENLEIIGAASPGQRFNALGKLDEIDQYLRANGAQALLYQDLKTTTCHYSPKLYENILSTKLFNKIDDRYVLRQKDIGFMLPSVINYTPYFSNFFDYLKSIEPKSKKTNNIYVYSLN